MAIANPFMNAMNYNHEQDGHMREMEREYQRRGMQWSWCANEQSMAATQPQKAVEQPPQQNKLLLLLGD